MIPDKGNYPLDCLNKKMKICFISGAYRNDDPIIKMGNIERAVIYMRKYLRQGFAVICPHTNTGLDCYDMEKEVDFCKMYLTFIPFIDIMVMMPGWQDSEGAKREHEEAVILWKTIIYEPYDETNPSQ